MQVKDRFAGTYSGGYVGRFAVIARTELFWLPAEARASSLGVPFGDHSMKRRLSVAISTIGNPKIVFMVMGARPAHSCVPSSLPPDSAPLTR